MQSICSQNDNFSNRFNELNNALTETKTGTYVKYNSAEDTLDIYIGTVYIGSIPCNFQNMPFDFVNGTTSSDWSKTDCTLTVGTTVYFSNYGTTTRYATYNNAIPITDGCKLNLAGNLAYSTADTSSKTQTAYGYIDISKDGGVTWTNIFTESLAVGVSVGSTSVSISTQIDLSAYSGYECKFRIGGYNTRGGTGTVSYTNITLSTFSLTY